MFRAIRTLRCASEYAVVSVKLQSGSTAIVSSHMLLQSFTLYTIKQRTPDALDDVLAGKALGIDGHVRQLGPKEDLFEDA